MNTQGTTHRMPMTITVSRDTLQVKRVEYADANEAQFNECCRLVLQIHGLEHIADQIPREGLANFHLMEI